MTPVKHAWYGATVRPLGFSETLKVLSPLRFPPSRAIIELRHSHPPTSQTGHDHWLDIEGHAA